MSSNQKRISSGTMTSAQGGYSGGGNRFAGLTTADEDVLDDGTAETIAGTISSHMANLSLQTAATLEASRTEVNASLQQMVANQAQLHQQQQQMMHQMAMISFTPPQGTVGRINTRLRVSPAAPPTSYTPPAWAPHAAPPTSYAPPAWASPQFQLPYQGGCGGRSRGGCIRRARGGGRGAMPAPMPFIGGQHMIPYIPSGAHSPTSSNYSRIRMCASRANLMWKIGTRVPRAPTKNLGIRMDLHARITWNTSEQIISFAKRRCTRRCIRACDGVCVCSWPPVRRGLAPHGNSR
jgi:hypothetical protein